jgi:hypothetical protein
MYAKRREASREVKLSTKLEASGLASDLTQRIDKTSNVISLRLSIHENNKTSQVLPCPVLSQSIPSSPTIVSRLLYNLIITTPT